MKRSNSFFFMTKMPDVLPLRKLLTDSDLVNGGLNLHCFSEALQPLLDFETGLFSMMREAARSVASGRAGAPTFKEIEGGWANAVATATGIIARPDCTHHLKQSWEQLSKLWLKLWPSFALILEHGLAEVSVEADLARQGFTAQEGVASPALLLHDPIAARFPIACLNEGEGSGQIVWVHTAFFNSGPWRCAQHPADLSGSVDHSFTDALTDAWMSAMSGAQNIGRTASIFWRLSNPPSGLPLTGSSASAAFARAFGLLIAGKVVDPRVLIISQVTGPNPDDPLGPVGGIGQKVAAAVTWNEQQLAVGKTDLIDRIALLPEAESGTTINNLDEAKHALAKEQNSNGQRGAAAREMDLFNLETQEAVCLR